MQLLNQDSFFFVLTGAFLQEGDRPFFLKIRAVKLGKRRGFNNSFNEVVILIVLKKVQVPCIQESIVILKYINMAIGTLFLMIIKLLVMLAQKRYLIVFLT
jgi:hypothetical protein